MRKQYITTYISPQNTRYVNYVLANSKREAEGICELRGLGEFIDLDIPSKSIGSKGHFQPIMTRLDRQFNRLLRSRSRYPKLIQPLLHATVFCSHVANLSNRFPNEVNLLSDVGVIHQLVHYLDPSWRYETEPEEENLLRYQLKLLSDALPEVFLTEKERISKKNT